MQKGMRMHIYPATGFEPYNPWQQLIGLSGLTPVSGFLGTVQW